MLKIKIISTQVPFFFWEGSGLVIKKVIKLLTSTSTAQVYEGLTSEGHDLVALHRV